MSTYHERRALTHGYALFDKAQEMACACMTIEEIVQSTHRHRLGICPDQRRPAVELCRGHWRRRFSNNGPRRDISGIEELCAGAT